jgi:hypothetical protein
VFEVGSEKMKVNDPKNCQSLRNIEPEQPFHLGPALAAGGERRKEESEETRDCRSLWRDILKKSKKRLPFAGKNV